MVEDDISYTRGRILNLERASGEILDENSIPKSLLNMVIKSFRMTIENAHWEWSFFNEYFSPIVVEISINFIVFLVSDHIT